jgi:hypothetical protein
MPDQSLSRTGVRVAAAYWDLMLVEDPVRMAVLVGIGKHECTQYTVSLRMVFSQT